METPIHAQNATRIFNNVFAPLCREPRDLRLQRAMVIKAIQDCVGVTYQMWPKCISKNAVLAATVLCCSLATVKAFAEPKPKNPAHTAPYQYRLGSGDKVQITTFGEPTLSGTFDVSGAGMVALPLVGEVKAEGLTTVELTHAAEAAFRDGFLKDPKISVEVVGYRPFYILGEVGRPGQYPYISGLTVLNAVATANGFTYRADTHHVFIKRAAETVEHRVDLTTVTAVEPGDTIRIKERYF